MIAGRIIMKELCLDPVYVFNGSETRYGCFHFFLSTLDLDFNDSHCLRRLHFVLSQRPGLNQILGLLCKLFLSL